VAEGAAAFVASIDDAGDVLVLAGRAITVGHEAARSADLRFLGDLDPVHARIALGESFHGGLGWELRTEPGAGAPTVDGAPATGTVALVDGAEVELGHGAAFVVRRSDASSASIVLELAHGAEAAGARRVLLMAPGEAGRARIGPRRRRHVPVAGLTHDVALVVEPASDARPARVELRCPGGARLATAPADGAVAVTVDLPLEGRVDVALGAAPDRLPPFGVALRPVG
jgi:hypothetical protein